METITIRGQFMQTSEGIGHTNRRNLVESYRQ